MIKKNKKGNLVDIPEALSIILFIVMVATIGGYIFSQFNSHVQSSVVASDTAKDTMDSYNTNMPKAFDYGFLFILVAFIVFSVIMARLIPSSPYFYIVSVIFLIFINFIAVLISHIYEQMISNNAVFTTYVTNLPFIDFIMPRMIFYTIIYTSVVSIALYTKE